MRRLLLATGLVLLWGCASLVDVGTGRRVELVPQIGEHDCGIAALAMLLSRSYAVVERRRVLLGIDMTDGLYATDVLRLADTFDVALEFTTDPPNPASDSGIIVMQPTPAAWNAHAVYLFHAYIYDPADTTSPTPYVLAYVRWGRIYYFLKDHRRFDLPGV
jgi:hypothetical protein